MAERAGAKTSGMTTQAAGWQGCIETTVYYDKEHDRDMFVVRLKPWGSNGGTSKVIAEGVLDSSIEEPFIPALIA